jgi:hypothetical protein
LLPVQENRNAGSRFSFAGIQDMCGKLAHRSHPQPQPPCISPKGGKSGEGGGFRFN